jgi:uncharacterized protein YcfL
MKKIITLLLTLLLFVGCKEEVVKKPSQLIAKDKMIAIMHDLALLDGIKYQAASITDSLKITPAQYIFKKYKVDSLQFAQSNVYYAADYIEYKNMFDQIIKRLDNRKVVVDSILKIEDAKKAKLDSILALKTTKEKDSVLLLKSSSAKLQINKNRIEAKRLIREKSLLVK